MSYSIDLRERALKYLEEGGSQTAASKLFKVSRKTLYNWQQRETLEPYKPTGRKRKLSKAQLARDVEANPDAYLRERAARFGVGVNTVWVALRQMKVSKKNDALCGKKA
ncbi:transposase [Aetokthonos hydrillicola Thurmond2011]|jgi:transposase|uniref:Transposase n=1 Tax=Aetokthonos hydrillicola Thurmond2011 TaxID=2712845 RepID=A0AAP5MDI4_9CYAN|nr:IS630 transposase-related protein [Aetokthonos hydrillicola]MBW4590152.1 transposase [Aetokthonos hydrillicola CCALA 1050]MDR9900617.1 transposase [Aetokthonos hydrillicola Thurmond2011]